MCRRFLWKTAALKLSNYVDRDALRARLSDELGGRITRVEIKRVDQVRNTTTVDVRYRRG